MLRPLVVFAHLLGAVVLLASSLYGPLVLAAVRRAGDAAALRALLRYARDADRANPIAALAVLVTGVWLGRGRWSEAWLVVSTVEFVATAILAAAFEATTRRLEKLAASAADGPVAEPLDRVRASATWEGNAVAVLANDVALLFLMVQQPGLAASLAVVLVANAAALAAWLSRRRHGGFAIPGAAPLPVPAGRRPDR